MLSNSKESREIKESTEVRGFGWGIECYVTRLCHLSWYFPSSWCSVFPLLTLLNAKCSTMVSFLKILFIGIEGLMDECVCYVGRLSCLGTHTARVIWQESSFMTPHVLIVVIAIQRQGLPLNTKLAELAKLASKSQGSICLHLLSPQCLSDKCVVPHLAFTKVLGILSQALVFAP